MDIPFSSPPKFQTDQSEVKGAIQDSRTVISQGNSIVRKRQSDINKLANVINLNFKQLIEREKKVTEWASSLSKRREELEAMKNNFQNEQKQKISEIEILIQNEEKRVKDLETNANRINTQIDLITNKEKPEIEQKLQQFQKDEEKFGNLLSQYHETIANSDNNVTDLHNKYDEMMALIDRTKENAQNIDQQIIKLQGQVRLQNIDANTKLVELKKMNLIIENLENKINLVNEENMEHYNKLSEDISNKDQSKKPDEVTIKSLNNEISFMKNSKTSKEQLIQELESKENEIQANILQKRAGGLDLQQKLKLTYSSTNKLKREQQLFLSNTLKVRSIKVETIADLKQKVFETRDASTVAQTEIERLAQEEKTLMQKLRAVDVKIECARADNDMLFTHDVCLDQLELGINTQMQKQSDRITSLNDIYESLKRRINGAELEATRLNNAYVSLVRQNQQTKVSENAAKIKTLKQRIKTYKRSSNDLLSTINFYISKCNNLNLSIQNKRREIEREKSTQRYLQQKFNSLNPSYYTSNTYDIPTYQRLSINRNEYRQRAIDTESSISNLISKISHKRSVIDKKRDHISSLRKQTNYYQSKYTTSTPSWNTDLDPPFYQRKIELKDALSIEDLIWAIQSETYVWRSETTIFAKELLLNTWKYQLDLFQANPKI